eukprot:gene50298-67357_t
MVGAVLQAASERRVVVVDGFIATAAVLVAHAMCPNVLVYCIFAHQSGEQGHRNMLKYLNAQPLLDLGMRLGEGSGAALAWPLLVSACALLRDMASFDSASIFLQFIRHYLLAVQFFTRIPVTGKLAEWVGFSPAMLRASAAHFPGVGWLVGASSAVVLWGLVWALPEVSASSWVAAVLCTVFGVMLTGAFHEDGLADTADGLGGSLNRERALDIMKDSRVGTYGALALVLIVLLKVGLLAMLLQLVPLPAAAAAGFGAHVVSRFLPLFIIRSLPHVGDTQQSKSKPL